MAPISGLPGLVPCHIGSLRGSKRQFLWDPDDFLRSDQQVLTSECYMHRPARITRREALKYGFGATAGGLAFAQADAAEAQVAEAITWAFYGVAKTALVWFATEVLCPSIHWFLKDVFLPYVGPSIRDMIGALTRLLDAATNGLSRFLDWWIGPDQYKPKVDLTNRDSAWIDPKHLYIPPLEHPKFNKDVGVYYDFTPEDISAINQDQMKRESEHGHPAMLPIRKRITDSARWYDKHERDFKEMQFQYTKLSDRAIDVSEVDHVRRWVDASGDLYTEFTVNRENVKDPRIKKQVMYVPHSA